jgi:hypothetical protein
MHTASGAPLDALRRSDAPWHRRGRPSGIHHLKALTFTESEQSPRATPCEVVQIADSARVYAVGAQLRSCAQITLIGVPILMMAEKPAVRKNAGPR